eukprot:768813-Hanusia_phi.AAC.7
MADHVEREHVEDPRGDGNLPRAAQDGEASAREEGAGEIYLQDHADQHVYLHDVQQEVVVPEDEEDAVWLAPVPPCLDPRLGRIEDPVQVLHQPRLLPHVLRQRRVPQDVLVEASSWTEGGPSSRAEALPPPPAPARPEL